MHPSCPATLITNPCSIPVMVTAAPAAPCTALGPKGGLGGRQRRQGRGRCALCGLLQGAHAGLQQRDDVVLLADGAVRTCGGPNTCSAERASELVTSDACFPEPSIHESSSS